ncbi:MAG: hypothetical protein ABJJ37_01965 [Roseibium sp.]
MAASRVYDNSQDQLLTSRYTVTSLRLKTAARIAASQSVHPFGASRPDLSTIDTAAVERVQDGWKTPLRLCTNTDDDAAPMIITVSAGADRVFTTDCDDAVSGTINSDDLSSPLYYEQVFTRQVLTAPEGSMIADYQSPCSDGFALLEKGSASDFECVSLCDLFQRFSERYGFHDTAPDWASCRRTP